MGQTLLKVRCNVRSGPRKLDFCRYFATGYCLILAQIYFWVCQDFGRIERISIVVMESATLSRGGNWTFLKGIRACLLKDKIAYQYSETAKRSNCPTFSLSDLDLGWRLRGKFPLSEFAMAQSLAVTVLKVKTMNFGRHPLTPAPIAEF